MQVRHPILHFEGIRLPGNKEQGAISHTSQFCVVYEKNSVSNGQSISIFFFIFKYYT